MLRDSALMLSAGPYFNSQREYIVSMAARYELPTMYQTCESVAIGGLICYGTSLPDAYRQAGIYAARIPHSDLAAAGVGTTTYCPGDRVSPQ